MSIVADETGTVVYSFTKNARETVRASVKTYRGRDLVDLRVYVPDGSGELRPTPKGVAVRIELLPQLRDAVDALIAATEAVAA